jgi:uncharacterized protein YigE (DUF2233 family)
MDLIKHIDFDSILAETNIVELMDPEDLQKVGSYVTDGYQGGSYFGFEESGNALTFGEGVFYNGQSTNNMVMTYTFMFPLTSVELAIVTQSGVLPRPTGVHASVVVNGVTVVP